MTVRFTEQNPPAVGKEYNFDSGAKVFKGGDWTKKENWVDPETWSATGAKIKGAITGQGRYEPNIPEIGSAPELNRMNMSAMRASMGLLNTRSSDEAKNIISNNIPNAQFRDDANGNTIAIINGQEYYINRPGFSAQDAVQTAYSVLGFLGIGRAFGVGKTGTSIGGNVARSAGTGSALSVAEDVISDASGAQRKGALSSLGLTDDDLGINLPKAFGTGVMTGLFQGAGDTLFSAIPALFTRTSILPWSAIPCSTTRCTSSSTDTSPVATVTLLPFSRQASPTPSRSSSDRAVSTKSAPASANAYANCSPSP